TASITLTAAADPTPSPSASRNSVLNSGSPRSLQRVCHPVNGLLVHVVCGKPAHNISGALQKRANLWLEVYGISCEGPLIKNVSSCSLPSRISGLARFCVHDPLGLVRTCRMGQFAT